jgi:protein-S-isoprenylcysteine O-methyltransferase Ste14
MKLRIPPLLVVVAAALLMGWIARLVPALHVRLRMLNLLALGLAALGVLVILVALVSFRRERTTVDPMKPHRASALVSRGIFRWSRNPMYLGFLFLLLGWGACLSNLLALLVIPAFIFYMDRYQIRPEEQALEELFGLEYQAYRERVRRWL